MSDHSPEKCRTIEQSMPSSPAPEENVGKTRLTRRHIIASVTGVASSLVVLRSTDAVMAAIDQRASTSPPILIGIVERIEPPNTISMRTRKGLAVVKITAGATVRRGIWGREKELPAFLPGDAVAVEGAWDAAVFRAISVVSLFHPIAGHVLRHNGDTLQTSEVTVHLTGDTALLTGSMFVGKSLRQLAVGDEVVGEAWREPSRGVLVAARIGVLRVR